MRRDSPEGRGCGSQAPGAAAWKQRKGACWQQVCRAGLSIPSFLLSAGPQPSPSQVFLLKPPSSASWGENYCQFQVSCPGLFVWSEDSADVPATTVKVPVTRQAGRQAGKWHTLQAEGVRERLLNDALQKLGLRSQKLPA